MTALADAAGGTVGADAVPVPELVRRLRAAMTGAVDASTRRRAEYSTDASNYRVVPQAVVFPRNVDDVLAAASVCREAGAPLTARGGGTSVAGNAVGPGVVMDLSRHLDRVVEVDPVERTARVLSFLPSKGGVGNTMLVVETAVCLAARLKRGGRVAILDLNLQGGTVADALDIEPRFVTAQQLLAKQ